MGKINSIKVGITVGDINGIGIETILKTFEDSRILELCTPVIFASTKTIAVHKKQLGMEIGYHAADKISNIKANKVNLINIWQEDVHIDFGKETKEGGKFALLSLQAAVKALRDNSVDVIVTAPINKFNIQSDDFNFKGHTEFLEANLDGESLMILMTEDIKIGLITGHIPVQQIAATITAELIEKKVSLMHQSLVADFNINKPRIAVLGLNPHCGDHGVIGDEDEELIRPVIKKIHQEGKLVYGPYAADSFFGSKTYKDFDGVLAMYHDQGLAPFKTLSFGSGVNFTAGLDKIRTSPDHGTAFEIAGKGQADHNSFKSALFAALDIYRTRSQFEGLQENKLKRRN